MTFRMLNFQRTLNSGCKVQAAYIVNMATGHNIAVLHYKGGTVSLCPYVK